MPSVLITGANRGLGLFLAKAYLQQGFRVFAGYRTDAGGLSDLLREHPALLVQVELDVSRLESVSRAAASIAAENPSLDILINNAAELGQGGVPLEEVDFEVAARVFDTNALGPMRVTQAFLPLLQRGALKVIANISSEAGSLGNCWRDRMFDYCMSKSALNMQSVILRNYLKDFLVVAIHPGWLRTDMGGKSADLDPSEPAEAIVKLLAARPEEPFVLYDGTPMRL